MTNQRNVRDREESWDDEFSHDDSLEDNFDVESDIEEDGLYNETSSKDSNDELDGLVDSFEGLADKAAGDDGEPELDEMDDTGGGYDPDTDPVETKQHAGKPNKKKYARAVSSDPKGSADQRKYSEPPVKRGANPWLAAAVITGGVAAVGAAGLVAYNQFFAAQAPQTTPQGPQIADQPVSSPQLNGALSQRANKELAREQATQAPQNNGAPRPNSAEAAPARAGQVEKLVAMLNEQPTTGESPKGDDATAATAEAKRSDNADVSDNVGSLAAAVTKATDQVGQDDPGKLTDTPGSNASDTHSQATSRKDTATPPREDVESMHAEISGVNNRTHHSTPDIVSEQLLELFDDLKKQMDDIKSWLAALASDIKDIRAEMDANYRELSESQEKKIEAKENTQMQEVMEKQPAVRPTTEEYYKYLIGRRRLEAINVINTSRDGKMAVVKNPLGRINTFFKGERFRIPGRNMVVTDILNGGSLVLAEDDRGDLWFIDSERIPRRVSNEKDRETKPSTKPSANSDGGKSRDTSGSKESKTAKTPPRASAAQNETRTTSAEPVIAEGWRWHATFDDSFLVRTPDREFQVVQRGKVVEPLGIVRGMDEQNRLRIGDYYIPRVGN